MKRLAKWMMMGAGVMLLPVALFAQSPSPTPGESVPTGGRRSPEERFQRMDKNHDGFITSEEARDPERFKHLLQRTDTNPKDGKISKEEFLKTGPPGGGHTEHAEQTPASGTPSDTATPPPTGGSPGPEHKSPEERFKRMDKNGDGFITSEEARDPDRFKRLVERMDNNPKDGKISKEEFLKAGPPPGGPGD